MERSRTSRRARGSSSTTATPTRRPSATTTATDSSTSSSPTGVAILRGPRRGISGATTGTAPSPTRASTPTSRTPTSSTTRSETASATSASPRTSPTSTMTGGRTSSWRATTARAGSSSTIVTEQAGVRRGWWGWGSTFADLDNDGHLVVFLVNGWNDPTGPFQADLSRCFVSNGDGTFTERGAELGLADTGEGRGVVAFDYDRDGDLDLFIANNRQAPRPYRNDGCDTGHFLSLRLRGRAPNTEAIGGRVYVTAGGQTQMRELRAGSNFESQDPADAHFGLGTATNVDEIRIVWPDGTPTVLGA